MNKKESKIMSEQINEILQKLQEATTNLASIRDSFQNRLDYFNEKDRRKINEFNETFDYKVQKIDEKIKSFVRFVEKSFAPTAEELAKEKALKKLRADFLEFDKWDADVQKALLEREIKNYAISEQEKTVKTPIKRPTTGSTVSIDNTEPEKAFPVTYNFEFCRPYSIEICGEKRSITSWRDALCQVADVVCSDNQSPLTNFIAQDVSKRPWFSLTSSTYRSPLEITNGIYTESNLSARNMLKSCRKLLDIYGVSYDNVNIYLNKISSNDNVQD